MYWLHVLNLTWIAAIAALGLNLVTGVTGQIVLGQAALMGLGAYAGGLLMLKAHWPWFAALPAALVLAAAVGIAMGLLSLRIKGHYLAITTLASQRDLSPGRAQRGAADRRPHGAARHPDAVRSRRSGSHSTRRCTCRCSR